MSHIQSVVTQIKRLDLLQRAVSRLCPTGTVKPSSRYTSYSGRRSNACEYVIQIPGINYEIGLVREHRDETTFTLGFDPYGYDVDRTSPYYQPGDFVHDGHQLVARFGDGLSKLLAEYVHEVAKESLESQGLTAHRLDSKESVEEFNSLYVEMGEEPLVWAGDLITAGVVS